MLVFVIQVIVLLALVTAVAMVAFHFPYPSPLIRGWLPPRKRWPEMQVRRWLSNGKFQPAFLDYFYRDPERVAPEGTDLLAPADGRVSSMDIRDGVRYLVIALTFWDMHVQRSPLYGTVIRVEDEGDTFMDGEGREFAFLKAKARPVQKRVTLKTDVGTVAVRLITSLAARRIEAWVHEGQTIERGQRIGRILLGSTVVLELPSGAAVLVRVGDQVRAGETRVATFSGTS